MKAPILAAALVAAPVHAVEVQFCWIGNAGYSLTGEMAFPDRLAAADRITEADVTAFDITGYRDGAIIGRWSLTDLRPGTSWNLNFSPREMRFATGGNSTDDDGQQWNASGSATDCGNPGFGFNAGASAQDICLDGQFIQESGISYDTVLPAQVGNDASNCEAVPQISMLRVSDQPLTP